MAVIFLAAIGAERAAFGQASALQPAGAAPATLSSNRFLFIVDTSAGMKRHANDELQTIGKILRSSASGQLHPGDSIGIWTFNDTLYTGNLPLQTWATDDVEEIALRTTAFLREQKYEKKSVLGSTLGGMLGIIKHSDIITIFIISDGSGQMSGTPFDDQLNTLYRASVKEMQGDPRPVITVLQAQGGTIIKYTENALPWPVVIPEVPIPIKPVVPTAAKIAVVTPPAAPVAPQPALVAAPTPAPTPVPTPIPTPVPVPAVVAAATVAQPQTQVPPRIQPTAIPPPTIAATAPSAVPRTPVPNAAPAVAKPQVVAANAIPAAPRPATNAAPKPVAVADSDAASAPKEAQTGNKLLTQATALLKSAFSNVRNLIYIAVGVLALLLFFVIVARIRRARRPSKISLITSTFNPPEQ